jgi:uncharacterized protein (TIGR03083 family)
VPRPTGEETAAHYLAAYERLTALAADLGPEQLAQPVPATPGWSVHDVFAHLTAIPTDAMAGRLTGVPSDDFTATQVAQRKDVPLEDILAEWAPNVAAMAEGARAGLVPPNLAVDAVTHEQDIRGALGLSRVDDSAAIRFSVDLYSFGVGRFRIADELPPLRLHATDTGTMRVAGKNGEPAVTVSAPEFEFFRGLSGRRGRRQIESYEWDGDPAPYLDRFNIFGGLPLVDVTD